MQQKKKKESCSISYLHKFFPTSPYDSVKTQKCPIFSFVRTESFYCQLLRLTFLLEDPLVTPRYPNFPAFW